MMQILPAYHSILVSLATGSLILAFLAIAYHFWFRPRRNLAAAAWRACEPVGFYAALFGIVMLVLAFLSGWFLRHPEALLNSPITQNKVLVSMLAIVSWVGFAAMRARAGPGLWAPRGPAGHAAFVLALAGTLFLVTTNSIGGELGGIPSGYERVAMALGFHTRHTLYFPTFVNVLLWLIGIAAVAGAAVHARRRGRTEVD